MIVHNLYVVSVSLSPHKTNAPLVIDADTVLPVAVSFQWMKSVAARHAQIHQTFRTGGPSSQFFSGLRDFDFLGDDPILRS
jgi:hypothetical protein